MINPDDDYCHHCGSDCTDSTRCTYCVGSGGVFGAGVSKISTYKERAEKAEAKLLRLEPPFPILPSMSRKSVNAPHPMTVPWSVAVLAYSVYVGRYGMDQSLATIAQRGGFGAVEIEHQVITTTAGDFLYLIDTVLAGQKEITRLLGQVQYLKDQVGESARLAADAVWDIDDVKAKLAEAERERHTAGAKAGKSYGDMVTAQLQRDNALAELKEAEATVAKRDNVIDGYAASAVAWETKAEVAIKELKEAMGLNAEYGREMDAVAKYLKPNWSNDMLWSDEIIIAIDQRVVDAAPDLDDARQTAVAERNEARAERDALQAKLDQRETVASGMGALGFDPTFTRYQQSIVEIQDALEKRLKGLEAKAKADQAALKELTDTVDRYEKELYG